MSSAHLSSFMQKDVLGELLHSMSQPLTSLRCSLEMSLDESAEQQQTTVGIALQQTERVIGMIQLMREYLDAEQPEPEVRKVPFESVLRAVVEDLNSLAEVRRVDVRLHGTCSATLSLAEPRLRLSLQYLILALIETMAPEGTVELELEEGSTESALRAEVRRDLKIQNNAIASPTIATNSIDNTLRLVRLAIARRVLEAGGTLLTTADDGQSGFLLRIPRVRAVSGAVV
jgi:signal transduction histidine kinase